MNKNVRMLVEAGVMIALAYVLGMIKIFHMPQGGSITAGQVIPIILFALRWGCIPGIMCGAVYGIVDALLGGQVIGLLPVIIDYPVAFGGLGIAGLFKNYFYRDNSEFQVVLAAIIAVMWRIFAHTISGAIFYAEYAPEGQNAWLYSLQYNGTFLAVEAIVAAIIIFALYKNRKLFSNRV